MLGTDTSGDAVHVALAHASLRLDGCEEALQPGMTAAAEIKTGRRSVIGCPISPLSRYKQEA